MSTYEKISLKEKLKLTYLLSTTIIALIIDVGVVLWLLLGWVYFIPFGVVALILAIIYQVSINKIKRKLKSLSPKNSGASPSITINTNPNTNPYVNPYSNPYANMYAPQPNIVQRAPTPKAEEKPAEAKKPKPATKKPAAKKTTTKKKTTSTDAKPKTNSKSKKSS